MPTAAMPSCAADAAPAAAEDGSSAACAFEHEPMTDQDEIEEQQ